MLAIVLSLIPHDMQYGPQAALIAESFPTRLRYSGAGIGYQLASVFAGGPAPLLATWLLHTLQQLAADRASTSSPARVVTLIATALLPEPNRARVARESRAGRGRAGARARAGVRAGARVAVPTR